MSKSPDIQIQTDEGILRGKAMDMYWLNARILRDPADFRPFERKSVLVVYQEDGQQFCGALNLRNPAEPLESVIRPFQEELTTLNTGDLNAPSPRNNADEIIAGMVIGFKRGDNRDLVVLYNHLTNGPQEAQATLQAGLEALLKA